MKKQTKRLLTLVLSLATTSSFATTSNKATITCDFGPKNRTVLAVNLKQKIAKQLDNDADNEFPVVGDMIVTLHTSISGDKLKSFNQASKLSNSAKVIWDEQLVLMGSNQDDSNFTMVVAYRFGTCINGACSQPLTKATLISYWDGLDGKDEATFTDKCSIKF